MSPRTRHALTHDDERTLFILMRQLGRESRLTGEERLILDKLAQRYETTPAAAASPLRGRRTAAAGTNAKGVSP